MRVRVLYFGILKDRYGVADEQVELPGEGNVGELLELLRGRTSNPSRCSIVDDGLWRSLAVAVNREYASLAVVLREGDEVALLPPVSGGSDEGKEVMSQGLKPRFFCALDVRAEARNYLRRKSEGHVD